MLQGRLPEIEELQRQMALTTEELTDLQYNTDQELAASRARQEALGRDLEAARAELGALQAAEAGLRAEHAAACGRLAEAQLQLGDANELYASLQGEQRG